MLFRLLFSGLFALLVSACSNSRIAGWDPTDYTVGSGDTIYSIAWRYELDPFELARWNGISSPYIIHPGQRLRMREVERVADTATDSRPSRPASANKPKPEPARVSSITVRDGDTLYSLSRKHGIPTAKLAGINELRPPYLIKPGQVLSLHSKSKSKSQTRPTTPQTKSSVAGAPAVKRDSRPVKRARDGAKVTWRWPLNGDIVNRFNHRRSDSKGIDISGREGDPVRAAAPGKVVYSGNGLISYGNLVIIKHNRSYLSAYAYNQKLLVGEGDEVKAGQVIAKVGRSREDLPRLHFEIRKNGKPVNPLSYLPSS